MRSAAVGVLVVLVATTLTACDLLTPRETLIPDTVGAIAGVDAPDGIAGPIRYTLTDGETIEVQPGETLGGGSAQVGDLLVTGREPRVWAWRVVASELLGPEYPAGCFRISGSNRKKTIDGQEVVDILPTGRVNNEPETWIRLPVAADFRGFVSSQGEVGGGKMCLNEQGEVFWAVGG